MLRIVVDEAGEHLDVAAQIWAKATSWRDRDKDVPLLELSRPVIKRVLEISPRSFLLMVFDEDLPLGFAAIGPVAGNDSMAELHYVGVEPPSWGRSVGAVIMVSAADVLLERGFSEARLLVYVDNERAAQLYERCGWHRHGEAVPHPRTGKAEQEYGLVLEAVDRH